MKWYLKSSECLTKYGFYYNNETQLYEKIICMHVFEVDEPYDEDNMEYDEPMTAYVNMTVCSNSLELMIHFGINTRYRPYRSDSYNEFFDFSLDKLMDMIVNGDVVRR